MTLACIDPEYEMTRLLESGEQPDSKPERFSAVPRESLDAICTVRGGRDTDRQTSVCTRSA